MTENMNIPKNWKDNFTFEILIRGMEYFEMNRVSNLKVADNKISATVTGGNPYSVEIEIEGKKIKKMSCTCPHAFKGNNCKHMAAVFYSLETHPPAEKPKKSDALKRATEEDLREFVKTLISEDRCIANRFELWMQKSLSPGQVIDKKKEVRTVITDCFNSFQEYLENYYDYYYDDEDDDNNNPSESWDDYVYSNVDVFIKRGLLNEAFDIIKYGWILINREEERVRLKDKDPDEDFSCFINDMDIVCMNALTSILEHNPKEMVREEIFNLLCDIVDSRTRYDLYFQINEEILKILSHYYPQTGYRMQLVELLESLADTENPVIITYLFQLLDELHFPETDIKKWEYRFYDTHIVTLRLSNKAAEEGNYGTAAQIIFDYIQEKNSEKSHINDDIEDLRQVIAYAKKAGDTKICKNAYSQLLTSYYAELDDYHEYRKLFSSDEWMVERKKVFANAYDGIKSDLLFDEGCFELLLKRLNKNQRFDEMVRYEKKLGELYPDEIAEWYGKRAKDFAEKGGKDNYKEAAWSLSHALKYPSGKTMVNDILAEWREIYSKRRSLWDELVKAGFSKK